MARIRTIKPEAFVSESLAEVSLTAERTFFGLLTQVDDEGRIRDNAAILHGAIWPLRPTHTAADVEEDLRQLEKQDLVCRYSAPDGKRYLHLPTFNTHQKISHPTPSRIPCCLRHEGPAGGPRPGSGNSPEGSGGMPESGDAAPFGGQAEARQASERRERGTSSTSPDSSGKTPESSGISQPRARAGARTPEVEVEVERELGKGELPSSSPTAAPSPDEQTAAAAGQSELAKPGKPKRAKKPEPPRADVDALCQRLAELMVANECKPPTISDEWRRETRLMLDRDGRDFDKAMALLEWSQNDPFWKGNIHSMPTFRAQYDKLRQKANAEWERTHGSVPSQRPSTTTRIVNQGVDLVRKMAEEDGVDLGTLINVDFAQRRELTA